MRMPKKRNDRKEKRIVLGGAGFFLFSWKISKLCLLLLFFRAVPDYLSDDCVRLILGEHGVWSKIWGKPITNIPTKLKIKRRSSSGEYSFLAVFFFSWKGRSFVP